MSSHAAWPSAGAVLKKVGMVKVKTYWFWWLPRFFRLPYDNIQIFLPDLEKSRIVYNV